MALSSISDIIYGVAKQKRNWYREILNKNWIPASFIFECLGVVVAAFIPIAILLLENGVEARIDRLVINGILNLEWFFRTSFVLVLISLVKKLAEGGKPLVARALDLISCALLLSLLICSVLAYENAISWLNDVPAALSTDTSYTSNPTLNAALPVESEESVFARPTSNSSSYKKEMRLAYLRGSNSNKERERRWEMFLNDENTYKYEGKNDLWIYIRDYYLFLNALNDEDRNVILRGFGNLSAHVKDIGSSVDSGAECMCVGSTMLALRFESTDWRAKLWAGIVAKYMETALIDAGIDENIRMCWLSSIPNYLREDIGVGSENNLKALMSTLWSTAHSFDVQHAESHVVFYEDVPEYIVVFYEGLFNSGSEDDFYEYVVNNFPKNVEGRGE